VNLRAVRALAARDIRVVLQSRAVSIPLIVVPLIMLVLLPLAVGLMTSLGGPELFAQLGELIERMPASLRERFAGDEPRQLLIRYTLVYMLAPLFLVVPMMVSSVIAADAFAGEKERKSLEALLYTPTSDRELFLAKLLAAWLPALAVSLLGFVVYSIVANAVAWPVMERWLLPNGLWLVLLLWVSPAVAALGLGVTVLISARVATFQEAYQLGGVVVVPIVALMIAQVAGVLVLSAGLVLVLGLALWIIDLVVLLIGFRLFDRNRLAAEL
jgi:ABC-type transport system involved in multi-copper enzyme maturation permease subunit